MNPNSTVRFNDFISIPKKLNDREKYLTAYVMLSSVENTIFLSLFFQRKYPAEQMQLIRKRLNIEFWLDDQLRSLYDVQVNSWQRTLGRQLILYSFRTMLTTIIVLLI